MKRYSIADLRAHLAGALDQAESGETVIVERRGRRFRLVPEPLRAPWPELPARIEILDPSIVEGDWGWEWKGPGQALAFVAREGAPAYAAEVPPAKPLTGRARPVNPVKKKKPAGARATRATKPAPRRGDA